MSTLLLLQSIFKNTLKRDNLHQWLSTWKQRASYIVPGISLVTASDISEAGRVCLSRFLNSTDTSQHMLSVIPNPTPWIPRLIDTQIYVLEKKRELHIPCAHHTNISPYLWGKVGGWRLSQSQMGSDSQRLRICSLPSVQSSL